MFMHGGIAHIGGNMLFLWIFGDNIEDRLGHIRYLIFYLLCGVLASLAHVFATALLATDQSSLLVPSLGASGPSPVCWEGISCCIQPGALRCSFFDFLPTFRLT
jgi:hypothetical protein